MVIGDGDGDGDERAWWGGDMVGYVCMFGEKAKYVLLLCKNNNDSDNDNNAHGINTHSHRLPPLPNSQPTPAHSHTKTKTYLPCRQCTLYTHPNAFPHPHQRLQSLLTVCCEVSIPHDGALREEEYTCATTKGKVAHVISLCV